MYIIAGLGNPGKKYEHTRHNMGFLALDLLADKYGIKVDRLKFKALTGEGRIEGKSHRKQVLPSLLGKHGGCASG